MFHHTLESVVNSLLPVGNALMIEGIVRDFSGPEYTWQNELFKMRPPRAWREKYSDTTALPKWPEWKENENTHVTQFGVKTDQIRVPKVFKDSFLVTSLYLEYARGGIDPMEAYIDDLELDVQRFLDAGMRGIPEMAAGVLLNAFSSSAQPLSDGTALVANSHTAVPGDNLTTTKMSAQLLREFDALRVGVDTAGFPYMYNWDTIIYGPDKEAAVTQALDSVNYPGNSDNDLNPWKNRYKNRIVCPWLDESVQTGASEYIFVADSRKHNLQGRIYELPNLKKPLQQDSDTYRFEGRTIYTFYPVNNAGFAGSDGSTDPS